MREEGTSENLTPNLAKDLIASFFFFSFFWFCGFFFL